MTFIPLNKVKKLSDHNYQWGIWNLEITDSIRDGRDYMFLDDETLRPMHEFVSCKAVPDAINNYVNKTEGMKHILIVDVFIPKLLRAI